MGIEESVMHPITSFLSKLLFDVAAHVYSAAIWTIRSR